MRKSFRKFLLSLLALSTFFVFFESCSKSSSKLDAEDEEINFGPSPDDN